MLPPTQCEEGICWHCWHCLHKPLTSYCRHEKEEQGGRGTRERWLKCHRLQLATLPGAHEKFSTAQHSAAQCSTAQHSMDHLAQKPWSSGGLTLPLATQST